VVVLANCPEVMQSYGAILQCGAVIVPVIFLLGDEEVAHILADSEAKVVVTSTDMLWQVGVSPALARSARSASRFRVSRSPSKTTAIGPSRPARWARSA